MEGDLQRQLGRGLRALRATTGLSQESFADLLGIHRTYIGGLERGERNVTLQTVERIAERLQVAPLALLDGSVADTTTGRPGTDDGERPGRRPRETAAAGAGTRARRGDAGAGRRR